MNTTNEIELRSLLALAEKYGSPLYVYDTQKITSQYQRITRAFTSVNSLQLNYAVKALSNISILKFFKQLDSGLDIVSIQEVQLGLAAGFNPKKIIYTPNDVSLEEIEKVASTGVQININNLSILELFEQKHSSIPVCVRINPRIMT